jgi:hypothetical protein
LARPLHNKVKNKQRSEIENMERAKSFFAVLGLGITIGVFLVVFFRATPKSIVIGGVEFEIPSATTTVSEQTPIASFPQPTNFTSTPTTQFTTIFFPANSYWYKTGIFVEVGQLVTITVTGTANTWGGTPEGNSNPNGTFNNSFCRKDTCIMKDVNYGALIGKIEDSPPFKVGSYFKTTATTSGELEFIVNDEEGYHNDNIGEFEITIALR